MLFDFDKFSSITASVYADSPYSLAEVLEVFRHYFEQYEAYTGAPHPPIRAVQIERIIREMPYIDETDKVNSTMDIDPDCYEDMIDKHFRTRYRNCDYKRSAGIKERTLSHYEYLLSRCDQAIGHLRLCDIRPQHLNLFYQNLQEEGVRSGKSRATAKLDLAAFLKKEGVTRDALASRAGVSPTTITTACRKEPIMEAKADQISAALGRKTKDLFSIEQDRTPLSAKTVAEYHRFIHTVMQQAEDELLIPYNPAAKASAPKVGKTKPDFYEPDTVAAILDAAEQEPIKWKTMLHLFLITGRRREDICGLKWEKIDFENHIVCIDTSLLYLPKLGIYESTTKTENTTFLPLPEETMQLLREYRAWYNELRLKNGDRWQDSGFLFVKNNGAPIHPDSFAGWLRKFTKRHNLPHLHPHGFRHTNASMLIGNGVDVVTVANRLGHADVSTTLDIYSHAINEAKAKASETLADVMLRRKKA